MAGRPRPRPRGRRLVASQRLPWARLSGIHFRRGRKPAHESGGFLIELAHIYVAVLTSGTVVSVLLWSEARRQRAAPGAGPLAALMLTLTLWLFSYLIVWSTSSLATQVFWQKMSYTGTLLVGPTLLAFVLDITGTTSWRTPGRMALIAIAPGASLAILWVTPQELLLGRLVGRTVGHFTHYTPSQGPVFVLWLAVTYLLLVVGLVILIRAWSASTGIKRTQAAIVLAASLFPFAVSVFNDVTGIGLPGGFDPVAPAVLLSAVLFVYALRRGWLLDLVLRARDLAVERMSDVVMVLDDLERVLDTNAAGARLADMTPAEALGVPAEMLLGGFDGAMPALHPGSGTVTTLVSKEGDDGRHYADLSVTPLDVGRRSAAGSLVMLHDVTDARRSEQRLLAANEELEGNLQEIRELRDALRVVNAELEDRVEARTAELHEMNATLDSALRAKSEFLSSMSHELRTPLNSIIGFSGTMLQGLAGPLTDEQGRQARMINASGRRLLDLVNGILDLSRIEAGEHRIDLGEWRLGDVGRDAVDTVRPLAQERGLQLTTDVPDPDVRLTTDGGMLHQILLNLLGNAIKYTDHGEVSLRAERSGEDVVFVVGDTGRGVSARDMERLFEDFFQARPADGGKSEGTGLGLPVAARLATMLGGAITATSELGVGSEFTVRLPVHGPSDGVGSSHA
jgi:signal transduction histidine kinase